MSASGRSGGRRVSYGVLAGLVVACLALMVLVVGGGGARSPREGTLTVTSLWESDCGREGAPFELEIEDAQHDILGVWSQDRRLSTPVVVDGRRYCGHTAAFPDLPRSEEYTFLVHDLYGAERAAGYRESPAARHRSARLTLSRAELEAMGWSVAVFYDPAGTSQRFWFTGPPSVDSSEVLGA